MYKILLKRATAKKVSKEKIISQLDYIINRGLSSSRGKTWSSNSSLKEPYQDENGNWVFTCEVLLQKNSGHIGSDAELKQWQEIRSVIEQSGLASKFGDHPWIIDDGTNLPIKTDIPQLKEIKDIRPAIKVSTWQDLIVPTEMLGENSDEFISKHPAWKGLYGVNPQIRIILSNIKRAHDTNGESRNHAVLFGHAGCGKTTTMFAIEQMFGSSSVLKLDATSTTKAGIEKLFFSELSEIPPLVFMEEAEKADPEALKIWLGALDDRGEIRKVNFRVNQLRQVKVLFICTVNNKVLFDKMMGSDGSQAGALSSRCVTQVYYPRPSETILFQILEKEIQEKGGKPDWISPAIEMASKLGVTDPRIVKSYLAGGDRLLDGTYQRDWYAIQQAAENFNS